MTTKIAGENNFQMAADLLSKFDCIGDTNEYSRSLNCIQDVLGTKLIGKIETKNSRIQNSNYLKFSDLANEQKFMVELNNRNDIRLYEKFIENSLILNSYSKVINLIKVGVINFTHFYLLNN